MTLIQFILTITPAIGFANAKASLADVMSIATGYETQLHSNVTAYDLCMYLATGYQYNQRGSEKIITTEAYDDHDQGVAKVLTRHVNDEYDDTTEALNSYNKTQRVVNFDPARCDEVTENEVIGWYFPSTAEGKYQDLGLARRDAKPNFCRRRGENCKTSEGGLDVTMCSSLGGTGDITCGCAEYGLTGAACQPAYRDGTTWFTNHRKNWGEVTALMIGFPGEGGTVNQRLVGFVTTGQDY